MKACFLVHRLNLTSKKIVVMVSSTPKFPCKVLMISFPILSDAGPLILCKWVNHHPGKDLCFELHKLSQEYITYTKWQAYKSLSRLYQAAVEWYWCDWVNWFSHKVLSYWRLKTQLNKNAISSVGNGAYWWHLMYFSIGCKVTFLLSFCWYFTQSFLQLPKFALHSGFLRQRV